MERMDALIEKLLNGFYDGMLSIFFSYIDQLAIWLGKE